VVPSLSNPREKVAPTLGSTGMAQHHCHWKKDAIQLDIMTHQIGQLYTISHPNGMVDGFLEKYTNA
jgi:hypothetical protein